MYFLLLIFPAACYGLIYYFLDASGSHLLLLLVELPLAAALLETRLKSIRTIKQWSRVVRIILYSAAILFFSVYIIIISENMYEGWFKLLRTGRPNGVVSFSFAYGAGLFTSLGISWILLWRNRFAALAALLVTIHLILLILFPGIWTILPFILLVSLLFISSLPRSSSPVIIGLGLAIVIITAVITTAPSLKNHEGRGSSTVDTVSNSMRSGLLRIMPGLPITYNIPGYGHPYTRSEFTGSRPYLTSLTLFSAEALPGTGLYLKTDIAYFYNGSSWISRDPQRLIPEMEITDARPITDNEQAGQVRLTVITDLFPRIPITPDTVAIEYAEKLYRLGTDVMIEPPLGIPVGKGDEIILHTNSSAENFRTETDPGQPEVIMQLPTATIKDFSLLAQSLADETVTGTLLNIREYLSEGFTYTLETDTHENPIYDFIMNTKAGYCVHFSSAAAILARMNDIPVRIAKGFMTVIPMFEEDDVSGTMLYRTGISNETMVSNITGYASHQWPEVYIEGRGWVPWEVTPPMIGLTDQNLEGVIGSDSATRQQLEYFGFSLSDTDESAERDDRFHIRPYIIVLLVLVIIGSVLCGILFGDRLLPVDRRIHHRTEKLVRLTAKRLFIKPPSQSGWMKWGNDLIQMLYSGTETIEAMLPLMLHYTYKPYPLTADEKLELAKLIQTARKTIGFSRKFRISLQ